MTNNFAPPPMNNDIIGEDTKRPTVNWQEWFNNAARVLNSHNNLVAPHILINPDFNWSRTKGNTPTIADGDFVEKWSVESNGMTFAITPTSYISTTFNAGTGSERYINVLISVYNANEFVVYQQMPKMLSKYQGKSINLSSYIKNNSSYSVKIKFYIGIDVNGDGIDEYYVYSKAIFLPIEDSKINSTVQVPSVVTDNQVNVVTVALIISDITDIVNLDIFYIKNEIGESATPIFVDKAMEKYRLDNPT